MSRPEPEAGVPFGAAPWRLARIAERPDVVVTETSLHRPGQLLLSDAAAGTLGDVVAQRFGGSPDETGLESLGIQRWSIPDDLAVPEVVAALRTELGAQADDPTFVVAPVYVLTGEPKYAGGPGAAPRPTGWTWAPPPASARPEVADVAVLDTGVPDDLATWHPELAAAVLRDADDVDELRAGPGADLWDEAGHGTFIAGLVLRLSPGSVVDVAEVLDPQGIGDDVSVTRELMETTAGVLNLSLGGYTDDDTPPPLLAAAIRALVDRSPDRVVVAAAGNNASDRPFWPAALAESIPGVVSVAAGDRGETGTMSRAPFSNWGPWVTAVTYGVGVHSTYVLGRYPGVAGGTFADPFARWDGTSFAAPVVAAGIAAVARDHAVTPAEAWSTIAAALEPAPNGLGGWYEPPTDPRG